MSYVSVKAKLNIPFGKVGVRHQRIFHANTSNATRHILTKEQYEKGMALSRKMRNMSAW